MSDKDLNSADQEILQRRLKERRLFLGMTYEDLANETGLSKSTLQRYETGGIRNLPYDKIFILSDALEVAPSYFTDLSNDYTAEPTLKINRAEHLKHIKAFEKKALQQIAPSLISKGYAVEQRGHGSVGDLIATRGNEIWHLDFLYVRDVNSYPVQTGQGRHQLLLRFGRLAIYDKPITKYSIVLNFRVIAEQLIKYKPIHLNIETSIIIVTSNGYEEMYF